MVVVAPGDPAPGGGYFVSMTMPLVNELEDVAFLAAVSLPGRSGVFIWSKGSVSPIAQTGDQAPGGGTFVSFLEVALKGAGEGLTLGLIATTLQTSGIQDGLFLFSQGVLQRLVSQGDLAPRGGTFTNLYYLSVNLSGQVGFYAYVNLLQFISGIFLVQPDGSITEVARAGDPAPEGGTFEFPTPLGVRGAGTALFANGGASYDSFSRPSLNENGDLAFSSHVTVFGRGGIFLYSDGQITRRIREQDPAPGGGVFNVVSSPVLNAAGEIVFTGSTSFSVSGLYLFSPEKGIVELVRRGQASPEGDTFSTLYGADLNASGRVAFAGQLTNRLGGIYLASPGEIDRIAGHGDLIDRDPVFTDAYPFAIDNAGRVLFRASTFPGGSGFFIGAPAAPIVRIGDRAPLGGVFLNLDLSRGAMDDRRVVFASNTTLDFQTDLYSAYDGGFSRIARAGEPAPGGGTFYGFGAFALNNSGDLALIGYVSTGRSGLFILSAGGIYSRAVTFDDPAPDGGTFSSFDYFSVNDVSQVAFLGLVTSPGRSGIFRWSEGIIRPIARTGDSAPGGGTFTFAYAASYNAPSLNARGDVAFGASLAGNPGVFKFSDDVVSRVAGPGDPAPGGGVIIAAQTAWLNDLGQVAFYAAASSGSGVYLSSQDRLMPVARAGDPAPGGGTFTLTDVPRLNGQTQVGFFGSLPDGYGVFEASPTN